MVKVLLLIKQGSVARPRNLDLVTCLWQISKSMFNKVKSATRLVFSGFEVLCSGSENAKLFPETFPENSNLDDLGISLLAFPCRTNLKMHNIHVTPEMIKNNITLIRLFICGNSFDLLSFERKSDLRDSVNWIVRWLNVSAGKTQLVSFNR